MITHSRRDWFTRLLRPLTASTEGAADDSARIARIDSTLCLPYKNIACFTCSEHCPEVGAIRISKGRPMVDPECCTGCGRCHDLCPAPVNAIQLLPQSA